MFVSSGFGQTRTAPQQGPPPKNLVRQPDGHFTAHNSLGTCRDQIQDHINKKTYTNTLKQSYHATYARAN